MFVQGINLIEYFSPVHGLVAHNHLVGLAENLIPLSILFNELTVLVFGLGASTINALLQTFLALLDVGVVKLQHVLLDSDAAERLRVAQEVSEPGVERYQLTVVNLLSEGYRSFYGAEVVQVGGSQTSRTIDRCFTVG
ncbi:hypothetical protein D3C72_1555980 [compost metagenome]